MSPTRHAHRSYLACKLAGVDAAEGQLAVCYANFGGRLERYAQDLVRDQPSRERIVRHRGHGSATAGST